MACSGAGSLPPPNTPSNSTCLQMSSDVEDQTSIGCCNMTHGYYYDADRFATGLTWTVVLEHLKYHLAVSERLQEDSCNTGHFKLKALMLDAI